jgi:hypothetical protein
LERRSAGATRHVSTIEHGRNEAITRARIHIYPVARKRGDSVRARTRGREREREREGGRARGREMGWKRGGRGRERTIDDEGRERDGARKRAGGQRAAGREKKRGNTGC